MSDLADESVNPAAPGTAPLDDAALAALLDQLGDGWAVQDAALVRRYPFPNFVTALSFVNRLAEVAEVVQHHPDITLVYGAVTVAWTTHDIGGLGRADFVMAARSDRLFEDGAATPR